MTSDRRAVGLLGGSPCEHEGAGRKQAAGLLHPIGCASCEELPGARTDPCTQTGYALRDVGPGHMFAWLAAAWRASMLCAGDSMNDLARVLERASRKERRHMEEQTPDFSLDVQGVRGLCPAGEVYAKEQIAAKRIPVLSCEGPCIRGEIARLAANLIAREVPTLARACHAETFFVPHSSMARWVRGAERSIMIDGCFLKCHGRVLKELVEEERVVHIDALPLYRRFTDIFLMDDVPEEERRAVARQVADKIIAKLNQEVE